MKRELLSLKTLGYPCCPAHDKWPNDTYSSRRSKHARSRDIAREHRLVRRKAKLLTLAEFKDAIQGFEEEKEEMERDFAESLEDGYPDPEFSHLLSGRLLGEVWDYDILEPLYDWE